MLCVHAVIAILGAWTFIAVSFWFALRLAGADTVLASLPETIAVSYLHPVRASLPFVRRPRAV
jgi:hypothetical protein